MRKKTLAPLPMIILLLMGFFISICAGTPAGLSPLFKGCSQYHRCPHQNMIDVPDIIDQINDRLGKHILQHKLRREEPVVIFYGKTGPLPNADHSFLPALLSERLLI